MRPNRFVDETILDIWRLNNLLPVRPVNTPPLDERQLLCARFVQDDAARRLRWETEAEAGVTILLHLPRERVASRILCCEDESVPETAADPRDLRDDPLTIDFQLLQLRVRLAGTCQLRALVDDDEMPLRYPRFRNVLETFGEKLRLPLLHLELDPLERGDALRDVRCDRDHLPQITESIEREPAFQVQECELRRGRLARGERRHDAFQKHRFAVSRCAGDNDMRDLVKIMVYPPLPAIPD